MLRVTECSGADAVDGNFGGGTEPESIAHSAYMLMYMRRLDVPSICQALTTDAIPSNLSTLFTEDEAEGRRLASLVSIRYCAVDDLLAVQGIGLLPADHKFRTVAVQATSTFSGLRAELSRVLDCKADDVLLMNYTPSPPFSITYERYADAHTAVRSSRSLDAPGFNVVMFVCHRNRICNVQLGLQRVVVVKAFRDTDCQKLML